MEKNKTGAPVNQTPTTPATPSETPTTISETPAATIASPVPDTEDMIYYVLGECGKDKAYLVHVDPSIFSGTSWTFQKIESAVTGTNHVTVIAPEHYDGAINGEVTVSLDADGNLSIH